MYYSNQLFITYSFIGIFFAFISLYLIIKNLRSNKVSLFFGIIIFFVSFRFFLYSFSFPSKDNIIDYYSSFNNIKGNYKIVIETELINGFSNRERIIIDNKSICEKVIASLKTDSKLESLFPSKDWAPNNVYLLNIQADSNLYKFKIMEATDGCTYIDVFLDGKIIASYKNNEFINLNLINNQ